MSEHTFSGFFIRYATAPHKDPRMEGPGTIEVTPTGLILQGTRRPGFLATLVGIIAALLGLAIAVAATLLLEERGIRLMNYRKGPLLVGMVALFAMIGMYAAGGWLADRLFSARCQRELTAENLVSGTTENRVTIKLVWRHGKTTQMTYFKPSRAEDLPTLLEHLQRFST